MTKTRQVLKVPFGTRYINQWKDYILPSGQIIVDKGVTGCGYTELCLTNHQDVILCSPRRLLLENKMEQHQGDLNILYLENNAKDFNEVRDSFYQKVDKHLMDCMVNKLPVKFMVTYDSTKHLIKYLRDQGKDLSRFIVVADEFQSIFTDAFFKAEVENNFVTTLTANCPNIIYLSATPMMEKYLDRTEAFKDLPIQILDWSESGHVERVDVYHRKVPSLIAEAREIVGRYQSGNFPTIVLEDGSIAQSREVVMYFNSVHDIIRIIQGQELEKDQVNLICAESKSNLKAIRKKLGKGWKVGKIPLPGETNKMFTFCTKTVYIGSDFYSDNASTYIFADPEISSLALDISLDLPQIAGRQRNKANPFKNYVTMYYKTTRRCISREEFDEVQKIREARTHTMLNMDNKSNADEKAVLRDLILNNIKVTNYKKDFVSFDNNGIPVLNKFIKLAHERAWEISQGDYQDSVTVTSEISNLSITGRVMSETEPWDIIMNDFLSNKFYKTPKYSDRLRVYCEFMDKFQNNKYIADRMKCRIPDFSFRNFYNLFGTVICKSKEYRRAELQTMLENLLKKDDLSIEIYAHFKVGTRITLKEVKETLKQIYEHLGIERSTPKATDLGKWFEVREILLTESNGKRVRGYEILSMILKS